MAAENLPATQTSQAALPAAEYLPASHRVQFDDSVTSLYVIALYVPAAHAVQLSHAVKVVVVVSGPRFQQRY